jgi:thiamine-phosphate diphosphorylase
VSAGPLPPLHVVTDDAVIGAENFLARAGAILRVGGERLALHLRGPGTGGKLLFEHARALVPLARQAGAVLLVNDRLDVALAADAHGAQVGAHGIRVREARRLLGPERLLGASVHSAAEAVAAGGGADFLLVGTLFPTPSHLGRAGAGPELLRELADVGLPLVGIGGITAERLPQLRRAGAAGAAVLRAVWAADDPGTAVERLLDSWMNG